MKNLLCGIGLLVFVLSAGFLWSQGAPQRQQVAVLVSDAGKGETLLTVEWTQPGTVDRAVIIESRDQKRIERGVIREIYGRSLILRERLGRDFNAGSRIYQ